MRKMLQDGAQLICLPAYAQLAAVVAMTDATAASLYLLRNLSGPESVVKLFKLYNAMRTV